MNNFDPNALTQRLGFLSRRKLEEVNTQITKYCVNSKAVTYSDHRFIFRPSLLKYPRQERPGALSPANVFRDQPASLPLTSPSDDPHRSNLVSSKLKCYFIIWSNCFCIKRPLFWMDYVGDYAIKGCGAVSRAECPCLRKSLRSSPVCGKSFLTGYSKWSMGRGCIFLSHYHFEAPPPSPQCIIN